MRKINREDMLELTRRMTVKRNCFDRIAGAYLDEEGYVDATFNRHFLKLKLKNRRKTGDCKGDSFCRYEQKSERICISGRCSEARKYLAASDGIKEL